MDVAGLKGHIQQHTLPNFLIFTGEEWKVQQVYIKQIAKSKNEEIVYIQSIADIYGRLTNRSFLSKDKVYVVRDDKELMTSEKLQSTITTILGENTLILLLTNVDKRTKFYKQFSSEIIVFEPLKPAVLAKYIQKELPLSDANCNKLMEVCEYDYGRCLLEIDKIKHYMSSGESHGYDCTANEGFLDLLDAGIIYTPPKDAIFEFVDAIMDRKINKVWDLYEQCKAVGEATMVMLSVLYNNAKTVLQVQECQGRDIAKTTGLLAWQINKAKDHINKYSEEKLQRIMKLCYRCQKGIVTGTLDEQFAMDYVLVHIL